MDRIAIITNGGYYARLALDDLFREHASKVVAVVIVTGDYAGRPKLLSLLKVGRRTGLPYTVYKVVVFAFVTVMTRLRRCSLGVERMAVGYRSDLPILHSRVAESAEAVRFLEAHSPDLIVSASCPQKLTSTTTSIATRGIINIHASLLPAYAGLAPYFWVLAGGEANTGLTIHHLTETFDAGAVLAQRRIEIRPGESAFSLIRRVCIEGRAAVTAAVMAALAGQPGTPQDQSGRSYFSHPTWRAWRALRHNGHRLLRASDLMEVARSECR